MNKPFPLLFWSSRVLALAGILFISLFALDSFQPGEPVSEQIFHFTKHLIPSFILLAIFAIACYKELWGGILFILIGLGFSPIVYLHNYSLNHSISTSLSVILLINVPFVVVGALFIARHLFRKGSQSKVSLQG